MTISRRTAGSMRFVLAAVFVLLVWFCSIAVATLVLEPTSRVLVFAPDRAVAQALAGSEALIVDGGPGYLIAQGQQSGFVRMLYAGGAWLVLPFSLGGCLSVPRGRTGLSASVSSAARQS